MPLLGESFQIKKSFNQLLLIVKLSMHGKMKLLNYGDFGLAFIQQIQTRFNSLMKSRIAGTWSILWITISKVGLLSLT
jgi:hypothetical protein